MPGEARASRIHLSAALAQRIVDELTPALQENLNLMDAEGFIIASGDVSRVGTLHPGAREAAAKNEVVSVYADSARSGERPGVNLPLEYRGKVIGVVGVTGKPAKVRSLAPVLVLTIALLFEREAELVGESRRDAADRDVLARLLFGSRPGDAVGMLGQRLPALEGPWLLAACMAGARGEGALDEGAAVRLRRTLGGAAVVGSLRGVLWVLVSDVRGEGGARAVAAVAAERIAALLPGVGVVHSGICRSAEELVREAGNLALLSARPELCGDAVMAASSLHLRLAAAQLPPGAAASLRSVLSEVTQAERETLAAYLASGVAAELSRSNYTHRNTVRRRLQSIAERTGFDLRVPEQAAVLALALAADEEYAQRTANLVHSAQISGGSRQ